MKNIPEVLKTLEELTPKGVVYPPRLLGKHNLSIELDSVVLKFLVDGGIAGAYYHWLTLLAQHSEAKLIVELGNRYGTSTIALYHGMKTDQTLVTVDTDKDQRYVPSEIFESPQVKFVFGDCIDLSIYEQNKTQIPFNIDILFTDTIHFYEQVSAEFEVYEPLLSDEALFVIDDININDKGKFWDELTSHTKYDLTQLCHGSGFGAIHYIRPQAERSRTKEERIQLALQRSSTRWKNRYLSLNNQADLLSKRFKEIRKKQRNRWIKKVLFTLTGKSFGSKEA